MEETQTKKLKTSSEWKMKHSRIVQKVKFRLNNIMNCTEEFENEFSTLEDFSSFSRSTVSDVIHFEPLMHLVKRLLANNEYAMYADTFYTNAKLKMLQLLVKHEYLKAESGASTDVETSGAVMDVETSEDAIKDAEKKKKKAVKDFVEWWNVYLVEQREVLDKVFNLKWLCDYLESMNEEDVVQLLSQRKLRDKIKGLQKNSKLSKKVFEELEEIILSSIELELNLDTPSRSVDRFVFDDTDYIDNHKILDRLDEYVDKCINHYKKAQDKMIAPYFAICQSSGYGKSRIVTELGKRRPMMYVSMQKAGSEGYPPRTTHLIDKCFRQNGQSKINEGAIHQAINLCYDFFKNNKHKSPTHLDSKRVYSDEEMKRPLQERNFLDDTRSIAPKKVVILVIDEARELLNLNDDDKNLFRRLRTFLRKSWSKNPVFAILVDTQSRISNFSPSIERDPSAKRMKKEHYALFHPFILTDTYNSMKNFSITKDMTDKFKIRNKDGQSLSTIHDADKLWDENVQSDKLQKDWRTVDALRAMGRPMWKWAPLKVGQVKLYGNFMLSSDPTFEACLAIVFCRVGGMISSVSTMSTDLVADYMATLLDCSITHHSQLISYISDPYLAYCAKSFWLMEDFLKVHLLPAARAAFVFGAVAKGFLGEFEARVIILCILDTLSLKDEHCWADVREFLNVFGESTDTLNIRKGAKVSVFHFVAFLDMLVPSDLKWLVQRRAAAILKNNHRGADILIPYWYEVTGNSTDVRYSYILVQVKNMKAKYCKEDIFEKLQPKNVFKVKSSEHDEDEYESLKSTYYTNGAVGIAMSLQSECAEEESSSCISYEIPMFAASGLGNYKNYLQESEEPLMNLLQDKPGVKVWQQLDKKHASMYEHRADIKMIPTLSVTDDSKFGPVANAMVYAELNSNLRKKI